MMPRKLLITFGAAFVLYAAAPLYIGVFVAGLLLGGGIATFLIVKGVRRG
jgi:hypothetical protein